MFDTGNRKVNLREEEHIARYYESKVRVLTLDRYLKAYRENNPGFTGVTHSWEEIDGSISL